jgi:transcriptional regulator with XRE-family HTH domain
MDMDHAGFAARLEAGLAAKQLKQADIAREAGVSRQIISQVKTGDKTAQRVVKVAADLLECSVEWLTTGTGQAPSWATVPLRAKEAGRAYDVRTVDAVPPWAAQLLAEVQALRRQVAALSPTTRAAGAVDELDQIMDPDEHPRTQAPTYSRPAAVPDGTPHGR